MLILHVMMSNIILKDTDLMIILSWLLSHVYDYFSIANKTVPKDSRWLIANYTLNGITIDKHVMMWI